MSGHSETCAGAGMVPAATGENPSRGTAQRVGYSRLGTLARFQIALRYAQGEKTEAIAAEYGIASSYVSTIAHQHGLARRGHRPQAANPNEVKRLKKSALLRASLLRAAAEEWRRLAE